MTNIQTRVLQGAPGSGSHAAALPRLPRGLPQCCSDLFDVLPRMRQNQVPDDLHFSVFLYCVLQPLFLPWLYFELVKRILVWCFCFSSILTSSFLPDFSVLIYLTPNSSQRHFSLQFCVMCRFFTSAFILENAHLSQKQECRSIPKQFLTQE